MGTCINIIDMYIDPGWYGHIHFFALSAERAWNQHHPSSNKRTSHPSLGFWYLSLMSRTRAPCRMADCRAGAGIHKMNYWKVRQCSQNPTVMEVSQSYTGGNGNSSQWAKLKQFGQQDKIIMNCNPNYKTNTYDSKLIYIYTYIYENSQICAEKLQMIYIYSPPSKK